MQNFYHFLVTNQFLQSNFLLALVTLGAASVALFIYRQQHRDEKSNAAQAIFSEVASAEYKLKGIRERFFAAQVPTLESEKVLPAENWSRYKYLFVRDLSTEEWNTIERFYNNCIAYDAAIELNNSYFHQDVKHIFNSLNQYYYDKIKEFHQAKPKESKLSKLKSSDLESFMEQLLQNHNSIDYRPQKPINDARIALVALDTSVSLSSVGQKLKQIAHL